MLNGKAGNPGPGPPVTREHVLEPDEFLKIYNSDRRIVFVKTIEIVKRAGNSFSGYVRKYPVRPEFPMTKKPVQP